jgi:BASS family bile acid:Na+ symporter
MALGTAQRNIAAALVVGRQNFDDPRVLDMVVVVALIELLILMPIARMLGRRIGTTGRLQRPIIKLPR